VSTSTLLWVALAVVVAVGIVLAARLMARHGVATVFIAAYRRTMDATHDHRESLSEALNVFRYRKPFNALTDDDARFLVELFAQVPDPMALASVLQHCESKQSVRQLQDREHMRLYADYAGKKTAT
jgi:hypothetical protein